MVHHAKIHPPRPPQPPPKRTVFRYVFYSALLLVLSMFVSYLAHAPGARQVKPGTLFSAVSAKRAFFFTARAPRNTQNTQKTGAGTGWTGAEGPEPADVASGSSANSALSTAYNYDKTSFDRLISYQVAVSFQPKDREETNIFKKRQGTSPAALSPTGEDNLFVSEQSADGYIAVGVADGVGGWSEAGYDSAAISRELCHSLKAKFEESTEKTAKDGLSPRDLLVSAFSDVQNSPKVEIGGTTACLGVFSPQKTLKVANLGDSWCGLFRDNKLIQETQFQTHNFNTPFQLAKIPKQILRQAEIQGKRYIIDSPDMADEYTWELEKDDVVIFATDGVTDNVIPQDIELFLKDQSAQKTPLADVSSQLVKEVVKVSKDPNYPSAFAQELSRLTGQRYMGGKEDDVTIVMVRVL